MQLAMIGLGRMGANMVRRLMRGSHQCVVYDARPQAVTELEREGAIGASSLEDLVSRMHSPRAIWLMLPAAITPQMIARLAPLLSRGDTIIDGGNSDYREAMAQSKTLAERGIHFIDVGTSGGVWGLENGYCLMIGGEREAVERLTPIFATLAPGRDAASVSQVPSNANIQTAEQGYLHCGAAGAGHFVKMIHNGIEYGLMAAYAEGLNILQHANLGSAQRSADAETAPLSEPSAYQFDFNIAAIAELWRRGSVVRSWLLDLTAEALRADPNLASFAGRVSDSGEGRWTLKAAVELGVPAPTLASALFARFSSRGESEYADKVLSAMRQQFGGHQEKKVPE